VDRIDADHGYDRFEGVLVYFPVGNQGDKSVVLQRYALRLCPADVGALEVLSRRLAFARNVPVSWSELVREGCRWVLACEGEPPAEVRKAKNEKLHQGGEHGAC
jgi:hypothetical protein